MERGSRSSMTGGRLPTALRRRGSTDQPLDLQMPVYTGTLKCPKCKHYFELPLIMPTCGHRVCERCVKAISRRNSNSYFHCPAPGCSKLYATAPDVLRKDRDLESKVRQHRRAEQSDRRHSVSRQGCQKPGCVAEAVSVEPCPHCELRLCQGHLEEDFEQVNRNCNTQLVEGEKQLLELQDWIEKSKIFKQNIDNLIEENRLSYEDMLKCIEVRFRSVYKELAMSKNKIEAAEKSIEEFYETARKMQRRLKKALRTEEDDYSTLRKKLEFVSSAERFRRSVQLPRLPDDVRLSYTRADIDAIETKIGELRLLQESLTVDVQHTQTVNCLERELMPHHAVLWCHTDEFCLDKENFVQRKDHVVSSARNALPPEVLIVNNMMKLYVLSMDSKCLGQIKVKDTTPFITKYLSASPDGKQLVLLSTDKVLICDMDGTKMVEMKIEQLRDVTGLCSVTLTEKFLMIVDPGNTQHRKPGAVFVLEGPKFDPDRAKRIPMDRRKIFPTSVTTARGSLLVLTNKMSTKSSREVASNELLMYDGNCDFFVDIVNSDDFYGALYMCSDASGRIFVSVSRGLYDDQPGLNQAPRAEVMVLDPRGRRIGSVGAAELNSSSGVSLCDAGNNGQKRLVVCDAASRLVYIFTLMDSLY